ncbi:MAG: DNA polymerase III subunit delta [Dysgonamonadaceae bacterium]|jgi:DNA polymerase-3 subunit delta|nr:DNA polymerase III subunit delta [Dysgonamonadaceae bacterium]
MAKNLGFEDIKKEIRAGNFAPVYLFHGEEPFFIDQLTELIINRAVEEASRDFDQSIFYGMDTDVRSVIAACKRFPMMSPRQLVVVREANNMKQLDELAEYVKKSLKTTILVINYKNGKIDGRKKLAAECGKQGIVFESAKLRDYQIPSFINNYLNARKVKIDPKSTQLLTEYLGADLSKLTNALEKLFISLPKDNPAINAALIEQNIGISKDYNVYELQSAVANKDILKANRIVKYFGENDDKNLTPAINAMFGFFSNLMICHYEKNKTKQALMSVFGFRFEVQINDYMTALRLYSPTKTMQAISLLREFDARSKGFKSPSSVKESLLKELVFKIMH